MAQHHHRSQQLDCRSNRTGACRSLLCYGWIQAARLCGKQDAWWPGCCTDDCLSANICTFTFSNRKCCCLKITIPSIVRILRPAICALVKDGDGVRLEKCGMAFPAKAVIMALRVQIHRSECRIASSSMGIFEG